MYWKDGREEIAVNQKTSSLRLAWSSSRVVQYQMGQGMVLGPKSDNPREIPRQEA
jgi:hypothetical protein